MNSLVRALTGIGLAGCLIGVAIAADLAEGPPAPPAPPAPPTVWNKLGLPDALQKLRDAAVNPRGKHPNWERKPLLKKIADPANLEAETPAIKAAAEIKAEEDLAQQKIKAIKYLATIGCGCYPDVKDALLAALDDCTEEVRYEAAMALCNASGNACTSCGPSCCSVDVMAKLRHMAYGMDENGCPVEPSARVRAAAATALRACRQKMPYVSLEDVPIPKPKPREVPEQAASSHGGDAGWVVVSSEDSQTNPPASSPAAGEPAGIMNPVSHLMSRPDGVPDVQQEGRANAGSPAGKSQWVDGNVRLVAEPVQAVPESVQPVPESVQPVPPSVQPVPGSSQPIPSPRPRFGELTASFNPPEPDYGGMAGLGGAPVEGASIEQRNAMPAPELGEMLRESPTVQSAKAQRRSAVCLDPNIRGYKAGQVYSLANGVYWTPARRDLDSMLSKIDPGMIQDVMVINGPYGLRYGPGFAFIDVIREPTPRYDCGFEAHFRTTADLRTNGGQIYGRETVYGGSNDWGFRFSYGHRRGSDYEAGNNLLIPSSYENRDVWGELSYDINPHQRVDIAYQRLDQTDTEYPGQFFDIAFLGTYGLELRIVDEDPMAPWSNLFIGGWHNRTRFRGDTRYKRNPNFPVIQRVEAAIDDYYDADNPSSLFGRTNGAVYSSGARAGVTFGDPGETQLRVGTDFRYLGQTIEEQLNLDFANPQSRPDQGQLAEINTNMPHSWLRDPGVYAEWSTPMSERWRLSVGGRIDWVATRARRSDLYESPDLACGGTVLDQSDVLYAFYLTNELDLARNWTLQASFGHAQRPPTLVERYSDGLFLGITQSGFTRVAGDPTLKPERNWQVDLGLSTDNDYWRGHANVFHAWVLDYITLEDAFVSELYDARLLQFFKTDVATLAGFELAAEFDVLPRLSAFGNLSYVDGRDRILDVPLAMIAPLESTVGLRLHDREKGRRWGITLAARIVNDQDRLAYIRSGDGIAPLESPTPGFTVWHLRGYWNRTENLTLVAGVENLFDKTYQEHLDLRLLGPAGFPGGATRVLSPGVTPYFGFNWVF